MTDPARSDTPASILSDAEIRSRLEEGDLLIEPLVHPESQIHSCKVDLRLSGIFYEVKHFVLDAYDPLHPPPKDYRRKVTLPLGEPYVLHPGSFVLAPTFEGVVLPNDLLGILQGRSSLGRLGIIVHATASLIDPRYKGPITLELSNLGRLPVKLYALSRIASLVFARISGGVSTPYGSDIIAPTTGSDTIRLGKYVSAASEGSKLGEDWEWQILRQVVAEQDHEPSADP